MRNFPPQTGPVGEPVSDTGSLTSSNANDAIQEEQNAITSSGQTLVALIDPPDNTQLSQALARYASGGTFGVDSGAADAYIISSTGAFVPPDAYFDGMKVEFYVVNNSAGAAATVNAFGIGVVGLVKEDGTSLTSGYLTTVIITKAIFDSGAGKFFVVSSAGSGAAGGLLVFEAEGTNIAISSSSSNIPYTNVIPINTGGTEVATVSVTPEDAANILEISAQVHWGRRTDRSPRRSHERDATPARSRVGPSERGQCPRGR